MVPFQRLSMTRDGWKRIEGVSMEHSASEEVLFEIVLCGNSAQVAAIHVPTNTEVRVICPATLPEKAMHQVALRKLLWVLQKKS